MREEKSEDTINNKEKVLVKEIRECVVDKIDLSKDLNDEELLDIIDESIIIFGKNHYLDLKAKNKIRQELYNSIRKYDLLQELLDNDGISEIMVNGTEHIFIEEKGCIKKWNGNFESGQKLQDVIQQMVTKTNRMVNESSPIVDARLEDGSRINVVLAPIAINGPIITIRKFGSNGGLTMEHLLKLEAVTEEASVFLKQLVRAGYNMIISGGTGSGKTTFLNALSNFIPHEERIITIEDSAELKIQGIDNLVRLETRNANVEGCNPVTIRDLIKSSLRMRPDRIIVGEVRGKEVIDMIQCMNTGHDGSLSTVHANSAIDALCRMETMFLMEMDMPLAAIRRQLASAVDIIVHLGRLRDKTRKVLQILEVTGYEQGEIVTNILYEFKEEGNKQEKVEGSIYKQNDLLHTEKLMQKGEMNLSE